MGNVFCFNGFNRFTWFNMVRITKNDRCLIKTIKTVVESIRTKVIIIIIIIIIMIMFMVLSS